MTSHRYIICGNDTDIGKTIISAFFVEGLNSYYWKPIQSGSLEKTDSDKISELCTIPKKKILREAYRFTSPVSPHWAAEIDSKTINKNNLNLPIKKGSLIIETAGGLLVPITRNYLQIDQIKKWQLPVILVCRSGLGTLNHTLLSLEALRARDIKIAGVILNGKKHMDNPKTLKDIGKVKIIAEFPELSSISSKELSKIWVDLSMEDIMNNLN